MSERFVRKFKTLRDDDDDDWHKDRDTDVRNKRRQKQSTRETLLEPTDNSKKNHYKSV